MPGNVIEVEVEYLGNQDRAIKGQHKSFLPFRWTLMGISAIYWLDPDYKLYLIDSPAEQAMSVRKGYEPLMKMTQQNAAKADQVVEVTKKTIEVPMRDGVLLATDVYLSKTRPAPVVLVRLPYDKTAYPANVGDTITTVPSLPSGFLAPDQLWEAKAGGNNAIRASIAR